MSAVILPFRPLAASRALCRPAIGAAPFTSEWLSEHASLVVAGLDLMSCDDASFERRCRTMRDDTGRALLGELSGQLQRLGAHLADIGDSLDLTAERIKDQLAAWA